MKQINSLNPVSFLLLGSAIFFMSCSKDEMFAPKESGPISGSGSQVEATNTAPVTATKKNAAKSTPTIPSSSYWYKVNPFTVSGAQYFTAIAVNGKGIFRNSYYVNFELYSRPAGSTVEPAFISSTVSDSYRAVITFAANPGVEYFFRISKMYTRVLWPSMESLSINTMYKMTLVGVEVNAGKFEEVGFSINPV
jgi:hypothetical protein